MKTDLKNQAHTLLLSKGIKLRTIERVEQMPNGAYLVVFIFLNGKRWARFVKAADIKTAKGYFAFTRSNRGYYVRIQGYLKEIRNIDGNWYHSLAPKHFKLPTAYDCAIHLQGAIARQQYSQAA